MKPPLNHHIPMVFRRRPAASAQDWLVLQLLGFERDKGQKTWSWGTKGETQRVNGYYPLVIL